MNLTDLYNQFLSTIANSKTILQLTEVLGIQNGDYVVVFSTQLQQPVKVKKENIQFPTTSFIRAETLVGFPNTGALDSLYLENSTNKLYKWDSVTSSYKWLLESEIQAINDSIALKLDKGTYVGDAAGLLAEAKSYSDSLQDGSKWKDAVDIATTGNVVLSGEQTIDGVVTSASRVAVLYNTNQTENGIYITSAGAWTRATDADTGPELVAATFKVLTGTVNQNKEFTNTNATITLGTTNITFAFRGSGTDHNSTTGKQGGTANEYYHLTGAEHTKVQSLPDTSESTANKAIDFSVINDTKYPSVKAVEDRVNAADDVKGYVNKPAFPATGAEDILYIDRDLRQLWVWSLVLNDYDLVGGVSQQYVDQELALKANDSEVVKSVSLNGGTAVTPDPSGNTDIQALDERASNLASDLTEQEKTAIKEKIGVERSLHQTYFKRTGEDLYILSKFDSTRDIQIRFRKCMANELYTFQRVGLLSNATEEIDLTNIDTAPDIVTLAEVGTDLIGPISISGYGFIGANHFLNNDGTTKTARTNYFEIFTDDIEVKDGDSGYFNELKVIVDNTIYDPAVLPTIESLINEKVSYIIKGSRIDVSVNHYYNKGQSVNTYYGMQAQNNSTFTQLYYGHSANADVIPYDRTNGTDSGASTSYPNVEKIVMANADKSICLAMDMNKEKGLGLNTSENVDSSSLAFTDTTGKAYFRLLTNKSFVAGDSYTWNGCYSWFNQAEEQALQTNTVWGYKYLNEGEESIAADFKGIATQYLRYKELIGKSFSVQSRDSTGVKSDGYFSERGLRIDSAYAESIKLKKYRELLDFSELGFGEGTPSYSSDVFAIDKNSNFYADGGATNRPNNGNGFVKTMVWGLNSNVKTQLFFEAGGSKGVYLSTTTNGVGNWSKINYGSTNSVYSGDVLAISENGMVYANLSATNKPSGVSAGYVFTQVYNSTYKTQLFFSSTTRTVFFNTQINGVSQWNELLTKTAIFDTANTFTVSPSVPTATDPSHAVPLSQVQEITSGDRLQRLAGDLSVSEKDTIKTKIGITASAGDMILSAIQSVSGLKTFLAGKLGLRNVADTFTSFFTNTNTASRTYTLQDKSGTLADLSDLALKANSTATYKSLGQIGSGNDIQTVVNGMTQSGYWRIHLNSADAPTGMPTGFVYFGGTNKYTYLEVLYSGAASTLKMTVTDDAGNIYVQFGGSGWKKLTATAVGTT